MFGGRLMETSLADETIQVSVRRGCLQEGILSSAVGFCHRSITYNS